MKTSSQEARIENVYRLEGRVPISKAIPFGLQHVLAMFVANVAPLIIISSVAVYQGEAFTAIETARLLQNCMLIAGIRYRHTFAALPHLGDRLGPSGRHGHQLYVPGRLPCDGFAGLRHHGRRDHRRRPF